MKDRRFRPVSPGPAGSPLHERLAPPNLRLSLLLAVGFCLSVFLAGATPAREPAAPVEHDRLVDLARLGLEELMELRVTTVSSVSRYEQRLAEAPSTATVITASEIKRYGYRTLADLLGSLPGFFVTNDRNYQYLGVRGFNRPGDYNTRILLMIDGHRINNNIFETAAVGNELPLDMDLVKRVEVVHGPCSSVYGTNAFFGVINILTRTPAEVNGAEVSAGTASFGARKGRITFGRRLWGDAALMVSGTAYGSDGPDLYFAEFDDPSTHDGWARRGDDESFDNLTARLTYGGLWLSGNWISREKGIPTAPWGIEFGDRRNLSRDRQGYVELGYASPVGSTLDVAARLSYDRYEYDGDYAFDYSETDAPRISINKDRNLGDWWTADVRLHRALSERTVLTGGLEFRSDQHQDQVNFDEEVYLDDHHTARGWGLFLMDEIQLHRCLRLDAGVRYDDDDTFGGTTNPRLALIFVPHAETTVRLLYGTAFRAPSAYEYYYHDGYSTQKPNPELEPESIETWELSVERSFGEHLAGRASGYTYRIDGLISLTTDPEDELLVFANVGDARARGLALELSGSWPGALQARAGACVQRAEDRHTGEPLTDSPERTANISVSVPVFSRRIFCGLDVRYLSERTTLAGVPANAHGLFNVTLLGRRFLPGLELSARVYNLFDTEYGDPGSEEHVQSIIEQDGRTFWVQCTYRP